MVCRIEIVLVRVVEVYILGVLIGRDIGGGMKFRWIWIGGEGGSVVRRGVRRMRI